MTPCMGFGMDENQELLLENILREFINDPPDNTAEQEQKADTDEKARQIFTKVASEVKLGGEGVINVFPKRHGAIVSPGEDDYADEPDSEFEAELKAALEQADSEHVIQPEDDEQPPRRIGVRRIDYTAAASDSEASVAPERANGGVATAEIEPGDLNIPDDSADESGGNVKRPAIWAWEGAKIDEDEDFIYETPLPTALKHYSKSVKSLRPRLTLAFLLCLIPVYITLATGFGFWLPDFITMSAVRWILLGFNGVMILLCYDIAAKGIFDLLRMRCGYETIAVLASIITMVHAVIGNSETPYCAVTTVSLLIALYGNYLKKSAIRRTFKTATSAENPYGVYRTEQAYNGNPAFFKTKTAGNTKGFVTMTESTDCAEKAFSYYVPILVVASVVFAAVTWLGKNRDPLYVLAACMTAGLPLGGMLCYAKPFNALSKRLSHIGSALAGWKGALSMSGKSSIILTDGDIFPKKTITFNGSDGLKIYGDFTPERLISYTAAMLIESGSSLAKRFEDIADTEHLPRIDDFKYYESGGLGAQIRGDVVLVGSYSFMMLMGIRIPQDSKVKNAAYIAVNGLPAGVFSMDYKPADLIQDSLKALIREKKLEIVLAVRDFTVTPTMVKRCFKVSSDPLELPTVEQRIELSDPDLERDGVRGALVCREGLPAFSDAVIGGRLLKKISLFNTALSIIGGALGVCIMFLLMYTAAYSSASAAHVMLYTLAFMLPVFIVSGWANRF